MSKHQSRRISPKDWDRQRLLDLLEKMQKKRVMVIGDVGVDRYTVGLVERICPEAPVPIVLVQEERLKLGLAANVADNLKTLNSEPFLIGMIGQDRGAEDFQKILNEREISSEYLVIDPDRRTVLKERVVSESQQLLRIDYESSEPPSDEIGQKLLEKVDELIGQSDVIIVEDYAKRLLSREVLEEIFKKAAGQKKLILVDPNDKTDPSFYQGTAVLTPNKVEAERLSHVVIRDEESLVEACKTLHEKTQAAHIIVTLGKDGMAVFSAKDETISFIPTAAQEVFDVSGAGDTVISVLAVALAGGATFEEAAVLGNLAAGVEVGKRGTATVSVSEIVNHMNYFF